MDEVYALSESTELSNMTILNIHWLWELNFRGVLEKKIKPIIIIVIFIIDSNILP